MTRTPPAWVGAPWWEIYGADLLADHLDRAAWVEGLARAWCLVRRADALTATQLGTQLDMVDRLLGRKFYPTTPGTPVVLVVDAELAEAYAGALDGLAPLVLVADREPKVHPDQPGPAMRHWIWHGDPKAEEAGR